MQNHNGFYQCPYAMWPYYYNYPIAPTYRYHQPVRSEFYRQMEDQKEETPIDSDMNYILKNETRPKEDVDRVIELIETRLRDEYVEITASGLDEKLLRYLVKTIVEYIDENYDKYNEERSTNGKVVTIINDLRNKLPWIFEILKLFGVVLTTITNFISRVVLITFENIKSKLPTHPKQRYYT
ncbi:hypothetical protein CPJCM30710_10480 [Clostridium polyendosporum]|uniref:Uncharacterized protein n=1 Tax=Clostridium polyendosporum TaxID=69208 RepID=A0A919VFP6_9CLOT|nr:hypothetical protein [Clostridium polyendosporum]GIM28382.1 hypothetical protein CPJCM30710_10480 [Clostridium polyendosporum]